MDRTESGRLGQFVETAVSGERVRAFLPPPLPPRPPLELQGLFTLYDAARGAVGRLDGVTTILPSTPLFLYMYVRKEALLSSQIEGTQSSLSDLLLFESEEIPHVPLDDADNCPSDFNPRQCDVDDDAVGDLCDNCVYRANPCQEDVNGNNVGDVCEDEVFYDGFERGDLRAWEDCGP